MTKAEKHADYDAFVEKFKPKKTTDDCYTPEIVYNAIRDWVLKEYNLPENVRIIRPFYPGKDYQTEDYSGECVVIDNPPFSILAEIKKWYSEHGVRYFLFAPTLTLFASNLDKNYVVCNVRITYENGAKVKTSFVTNMGDCKIFVSHELNEIIKQVDKEAVKNAAKLQSSYNYPDHVISAARIARLADYGVSLQLDAKDLYYIRKLDSQHQSGKAVYGGGFLLSEAAAAKKMMAERMAEERKVQKAAAEAWELSEREWEIIKSLG